jgi:hypothetical protein
LESLSYSSEDNSPCQSRKASPNCFSTKGSRASHCKQIDKAKNNNIHHQKIFNKGEKVSRYPKIVLMLIEIQPEGFLVKEDTTQTVNSLR